MDSYHDYKSVTIDKIWFDFDSTDCFKRIKEFHEVCANLRHFIVMSGRGYHFYLFTKPMKFNDEQKAIAYLEQLQYGIVAKVNENRRNPLTVGFGDGFDIDQSCLGDIARITRVVNTWNPGYTKKLKNGKIKKKVVSRYCIPIIGSDLLKSHEEICKIAANQRAECETFGKHLIEADMFKNVVIPPKLNHRDITNFTPSYKGNGDFSPYLKRLPLLIQKLLLNGKDGHWDRYITILALRETGIVDIRLCTKICQRYWSEEKFAHAIEDTTAPCGQIDYVYSRANLYFPTWDTLRKKGYPITKEDRKFSFYKKVIK